LPLRSDPASGPIIEDLGWATFAPEDLELQGVLVGQMRAYR
jgi:hypothetical protein